LVNLLRPHRERVRMVVDTYGPPLAALLELHPALIAPNEVELAELSGGDVENPGQAAATARRAQQRGAREVLVRLGADGAVLLRADGSAIAAPAPRVPVTSTVGAGDASLAGFLWKQSEGPEAALVASVAAGSAACTEPTAGRLDPDLVERLRGQVDVRQVEAGKVPGGS
jgi:1-phosphofructokinase